MVRLRPTNTTAQYDDVRINMYGGFGERLITPYDNSSILCGMGCAYCGKRNKPDAYNCEFCGAPLKEG